MLLIVYSRADLLSLSLRLPEGGAPCNSHREAQGRVVIVVCRAIRDRHPCGPCSGPAGLWCIARPMRDICLTCFMPHASTGLPTPWQSCTRSLTAEPLAVLLGYGLNTMG